MAFVAGSLVEAAVSFAMQKLGDFAVGTSQQFLEIADDINFMKGELSMMKAILKDAERRMETSETFNEWVKQVKSATFMIEDFMDEYNEYIYAEQALQGGGSSSSSWFKVQNFKSQIVSRIKFIKNELAIISKRGQAYGIHPTQSFGLVSIQDEGESSRETQHRPVHSSPQAFGLPQHRPVHSPPQTFGLPLTQSFGLGCKQDEGESSRAIQHRPVHSSPFEEAHIIGFDEDVRKLMDWLLSEEEMTKRSIMSIVGMGGSGKTTLAKKVYSLAQSHFDYHFWVNASQYSPSQLCDFLEDIVEDLRAQSQQSRRVRRKFTVLSEGRQSRWNKSMHGLQQFLRNMLYDRRYAIFIDDINDISFWRALEGGLPTYGGRGKIIFTSRGMITNSIVDGNCYVHMLKPLPFELAWDLFGRNAFQNYNPPRSCPSYLNELGAAIVRSCCGLPLAIVLMGCLMSNKGKSPKKWKDVVDHFDLELRHNPGLESLNWVLQTSYNHLPTRLKYCFLYCCLFPKNYRIKRKKMTRLWVAQGFVEKQQGKLLEDVADDYFIQLIERTFLHPVISEFTGEVIAGNIHEIMHNFAISKFPEEFGILTKEPCNECEQKRLLALHNYEIPCNRKHSKARSFLFFHYKSSIDCFMDELDCHKFLMVLCLDGIEIKKFPSKLGDLFHLRYLSLRRTSIAILPDSLGKLYNLETLDVRDTRIRSIQTNLENFQKLRHLLLNKMKAYGTNRLVTMPTSIGNLNLLQTLVGVEADDNFFRELRHLEQLRKLYIRWHNLEHSAELFQHCPEHLQKLLFASIQKMKNLYSLKVESLDTNGKYTELRLGTPFQLPEFLEKLALGGVIMELPPWFGHLSSLCVLVLINSLLIDDPLSDLAKLPNLVSLKLIHAYTGEKMGCGPGGFPKLRHLHMASLVEFEEWTVIAEGAMPCIKFLSIVDCWKLRKLPEGFERLKTLQSLELIGMPDEFIARLMVEGKSKIQHIPKKNLA